MDGVVESNADGVEWCERQRAGRRMKREGKELIASSGGPFVFGISFMFKTEVFEFLINGLNNDMCLKS